MPVSIDGVSYYAESVSISESIPIETFSALGTKESYVLPINKLEGNINIDFYITSSNQITKITDQYAKNNFINISAGPFSMQKCLLSSFSVDGNSESLIKASCSYNYYNQMTKGSTPAVQNQDIKPAHGAASTSTLSSFGFSSLLNFQYSFNQTFDIQYEIGSSVPSKTVFNGGDIALSITSIISDITFNTTNLIGTNATCDGSSSGGVQTKSGTITLKNLCENNVGTIEIDGFLQERSIGTNPGEEITETLKILQKYVLDQGCDE